MANLAAKIAANRGKWNGTDSRHIDRQMKTKNFGQFKSEIFIAQKSQVQKLIKNIQKDFSRPDFSFIQFQTKNNKK